MTGSMTYFDQESGTTLRSLRPNFPQFRLFQFLQHPYLEMDVCF